MASSRPAKIVGGYIPGSIGRITELHGVYYHAHWDFGLFFEAKVGSDLCSFLRRYDDTCDGIWTATTRNRIEGAVAIDGRHAQNEGAHLRWFIVSDALRGQGIGRQLLETAIAFCRQKQYDRVFLWTFKGLEAARHLYESLGFKLVYQQEGKQWGTTVTEQKFERGYVAYR
jgi:GNAT superfamily N-acetyltransferase